MTAPRQDRGAPPPGALPLALEILAPLSPGDQLAEAERRLAGGRGGPLGHLPIGSEVEAAPARLDGSVLEAVVSRALARARGAVFTAAPEARILASFGLAKAASRRGIPLPRALEALLGLEPAAPALTEALQGLAVLDPACGGGALLSEAERLARRCGARLDLHGIDVAPLAARACSARLALLGARASVVEGDALAARWPAADLVLSNPPFLRHEALPPQQKALAARRSGLPRQADLSAHLCALAIRHAPVAALVWPRALHTARSAAPLLADARARGGFALLLRSRAAGSFAASVDTALAVWAEGGSDRPGAEASVALSDLEPAELAALARGVSTRRLEILAREGPPPRGAVLVGDLCRVRFGLKTGCNAFFHLRPLGGRRHESELAGEVELAAADVAPVLATLKEARAPEDVRPTRLVFRPRRDTATARAYVERGERLRVHLRPTCAGRSPWWLVAPGRLPAPVLYPAKVGARAFAVLNRALLWEDKKWHALFPSGIEPWLLAVVLSSTPVRLAVDRAARQLTGAQAIADVDCRILAGAPFPRLEALMRLERRLGRCAEALARDPVGTDLAAALDRPAQRELDELVVRAFGLPASQARRDGSDLLARVTTRLEHAARVRERLERDEGLR